jgi:serine/threonine-protein phosphatase PGAM5
MKYTLAVLLLLAGLAQAAEIAAPAPRTIVLVRHGNYVADPKADEKTGPPLSPLGVAQAHLAGARLRASPTPFDAFYVSPMQRARDTAAAIGDALPDSSFTVDDDLRECTPPTRRGTTMAGEKPGALAACRAQLDRVFARYFVPASGAAHRDLFVCHGNVIRYLVTRVLGVDSRAWLEMSVGHASITTIFIKADGSMQLIGAGDVGHIPPGLQSGSSADKDDPARSLLVPRPLQVR